MMVRSPRQPIDLRASTADVKARCTRVLVGLEVIEQHKDPIFHIRGQFGWNSRLAFTNLKPRCGS
jgi:hypothetical protein